MFTTSILLPYIDPVALKISAVNVHWYGISYLLGILLGWYYLKYICKKTEKYKIQINISDLSEIIPWIVLGILLGGRLGYVFIYDIYYFIDYPLDIIKIWTGGMSFHGGLIGLVIALYYFTKRKGKKFFAMMDLIAIAAPIGIFFGRISNFINAELIGKVSNVKWAVIYPNEQLISRHPSQIYEAILEGIVIFFILFYLTRKYSLLAKSGLASALFLILYGFFRIICEFYRLPDQHIGYLINETITMGIIISLPMILTGFALIIYKRNENE
jgi:phosphatidylglycerol:prolipoprotein diacylglycerol transferase|tara:strand:- start:643 stop:1455 length:813 start_codon:yes stop_codon:yes gene_type:complete